MSALRITPYCVACGSTDVQLNGYAFWVPDTQEWEWVVVSEECCECMESKITFKPEEARA